ncbi:fatty acid synthase-like [Polistes fuscatus]|uniref:fatty acid synthase-like n=1 Tax=Polistes fuscatus TaxID=30207 RepID=UPI001CAA15B6|nr:fatty acid synthase-like [Polistes fuscatus]
MNLEGLDNSAVISGISGKFPKSININDLKENLLNGEDCVIRVKIRAIQAKFMAPEIKIALEVTFEAIIDAGINPVELRNKKTNFYGVLSLYESDSNVMKDKTQSLLGYCRGLLANWISFCMGLTGSSCTIDSTSTSSSLAIQKSYDAIKAGDCDYAIVYCQQTW